MPSSRAVADLAEDVGAALLRFAEQLRAESGAPTAAAMGAAPPDRSGVGETQKKMLDALDEAGSDGMTTLAIAERVGVAKSNVPRAMKALRDRGLVVGGDGAPAVWHLTSAGQGRSDR